MLEATHMAISDEMRTLFEKVDSIQSRFLESLITGRPHPIFKRRETTRLLEDERDRATSNEQE